jgi:uncharacterized membrane protein YdbT with pleckstrin-like domain
MASGYAAVMHDDTSERVLLRCHPSWRAMLGFHLKGFLLAVLAGVIAGVATRLAAGHVQVGWVVVAVVVVFVAALALGVLRRVSTTYMVTDHRLVIERGLLRRDVQEARLERVQNVASRQSVPERLMRVGSVHFDTAAGAGYDFSFYGVSGPRDLVRTVDAALRTLPAHESLP